MVTPIVTSGRIKSNKPIKKSVPESGVQLEFIVDNNAGILPDIPQANYGSCMMNMPLIEHHLMANDEDKKQITKINERIKNDIDMARATADSKNVYAHQTDFLFYKQSQGVNWVREIAFRFIEPVIDLNRWTLAPVDGWGIKYNKGDRARRHSHWPYTWAFVYFVDSCPKCSYLEIYDTPDPAIDNLLERAREFDQSGQAIPKNMMYKRHSVKPDPGKMVIFPGWVPHEVFEHECDHPRYVVAGNVAMLAVEPQGMEVNVDGYVSGNE